MSKYPIGFWNYTPVGMLGPEAVKDWTDLGMNMALSPEFPEGADPALMLPLLDACAEAGVKVIMSDRRARWYGAAKEPEKYRERFAAALADFGSHPAVMGFHVGDEPTNEESFADCITSHRIQLEMAPHLTPHLNFLPYWKGIEQSILKAPTFADWAKSMVEKADLRILCYDCYCQMNPNDEGVDQYFTNLRKFAEAAEAAGIEPWTTLLSVGHFRYRVPNEDDFRWQINTAAACGMRGILWFFIYMREPHSNYRLAPIDEFGERSETFERLSRVNRHFAHHFGDFFMEAKHLGTFCTVTAYGGYPLFEDGVTDPALRKITCPHNLPAIVSFFEREGRRHVAVVNNSTRESGQFRLHFAKDHPVLERFNWNHSYSPIRHYHHDAFWNETDTEIIGGDWLAPGEMKVYRIS
ncbi:MAG: hypothetical protein GX628_08225 [Clostridiales bacterium]|nr:hypothetical protein [Clostridiales bacterium]